MKRTAMAVALAAMAVSSLAQADFRMEAGLSYLSESEDRRASDPFSGDATAISGDFRFYLAPVRTAGHPLAEAPFLERASSIGVSYSTFDFDDNDAAERDRLNLQGEFYFNRFYTRAEYSKFDQEDGNASNDPSIIGLRIGYVPVDGLRLAVGVDSNDPDVRDIPLTPDDESDSRDDVVLEAKYVTKLARGTAMNLEGELTFADDAIDTTTLNLVADYFFTPAFSAGVRVDTSDDDGGDGSTNDFGAGAQVFFTPAFSGRVEYMTTNDGDDDIIGARLALRF